MGQDNVSHWKENLGLWKIIVTQQSAAASRNATSNCITQKEEGIYLVCAETPPSSLGPVIWDGPKDRGKGGGGGVIEEIGVWLATKLGEKGIKSEMYYLFLIFFIMQRRIRQRRPRTVEQLKSCIHHLQNCNNWYLQLPNDYKVQLKGDVTQCKNASVPTFFECVF